MECELCSTDEVVEFFPTSPDGDPAGFTVGFATEEAAEFGDFTIEFVDRQIMHTFQVPARRFEHLQPQCAATAAE